MKKTIALLFAGLFILLGSASQVFAQATNEEVKSWAEKAAVTVLNFGFTDFDERKAANKPYFTEKGYQAFYEALEQSMFFKVASKGNLSATSVLKCPAQVTEAVNAEGVKGWQVDFPLEVSHTNKNESWVSLQKVTVRVEQDTSTQALGIAQWIAMPFSEIDTLPCTPETPAAPAPTDE